METGTGKSAISLSKIFCGTSEPGPVIPLDLDDLPVRESSSSVYIPHKIRVVIHFAPVEAGRNHKGQKRQAHGNHQASRCPFCRSLVASGLSWEDHTYFCQGVL